MRRDHSLDLVSLNLAGPQALLESFWFGKRSSGWRTRFWFGVGRHPLSGFGKFLPFWPVTSVSEDSSAECTHLPLTLTFCEEYFDSRASLMAQLVKNSPAMQTWVRSLGLEDPLEKGKATHSSILGSQRVRHN